MASERLMAFLIIIFVAILVTFSFFMYNCRETFKNSLLDFFANVTDSVTMNNSKCIDYIPYQNVPDYPTKKGTIFISIASYRDNECSLTVDTIYRKAKNPENVYLGICEQNKKGHSEEECYSPIVKKYKGNIRYHNMDYSNAKGPTYARYWCSQLWRGEEYFLQIDSHTFFEPDWDAKLIKMLEQCRKETKKPVLSVYPATDDQLKLKGFPTMDHGKIGKNGIPSFLAGFWEGTKGKSEKPIRSPKPFIAAGYFFCDAKFLKEIPYDPNLSHLFQGEETLFSARMFTHGYDVFAPNINICSHHYSRPGPLYFNEVPNHNECRQKAEKRVLYMLGLQPKNKVDEEFLHDVEKYGFGKVRSLEDFWKASGIDLKKKTLERWGPKTKKEDVSDKFKGWNFHLSGYEKIKKY